MPFRSWVRGERYATAPASAADGLGRRHCTAAAAPSCLFRTTANRSSGATLFGYGWSAPSGMAEGSG
jgi:hypothetical protein